MSRTHVWFNFSNSGREGGKERERETETERETERERERFANDLSKEMKTFM